MNNEKFGELVGASIATGAPVTPEQLASVFTNAELLRAAQSRDLDIGAAAITNTAEVIPSSEAPSLSPESLLEGFDQAHQTYNFLLDAANGARAESGGHWRPKQLSVIDQAIIRADLEAILANKAVVDELATSIDCFTAYPEVNSPKPGFELVIIPEGLTYTDERAIAESLQNKINSYSASIRPRAYNGQKTLEVTSKGYRIAFAPKHYNIPKGNTANQKDWIDKYNQRTTATQLETATDAEAMAYINNLVDTRQLANPNTRFGQTHFRRSDQDAYNVPCVYVIDPPYMLCLDLSSSLEAISTRALVVPKV